jgi:hypothetical protein
MITFNTLGVHGQLGNQMFQYALLQGIYYKSRFEIVFTPKIKNQSYLFNIFNLQNYHINDKEINNEYREIDFTFNNEVFNLDNTSFFGYFQSEKYFIHCIDKIKKEFTFKDHIINTATEILNPYKNKTLISAHVRRGDYLINPDYHPLPSLEYYKKAFNYLDDGNTIFVCVSNDIEWCKANLIRDNIIYLSNNLDIDMCIISQCDHHIIANSTFSWWGSWLGMHPNKKIIAPTPWFGPKANHDTKDLYKEDFIIL